MKYTFRIYILLRIKKRYFIRLCCLFLESSKAVNVSLNNNRYFFCLILYALHLIFRVPISQIHKRARTIKKSIVNKEEQY